MQATFKLDPYVTLEIGGEVRVPMAISDRDAVINLSLSRLVPRGLLCSSAGWPAEPCTMTEAQAKASPRPFYGPFPCEYCGVQIVRAEHAEGGQAFDVPSWPIYPNSTWEPHQHRNIPDPTPETIYACALRPSHARAVASAILSAATEAKRA
jgi:hypothetical protein